MKFNPSLPLTLLTTILLTMFSCKTTNELPTVASVDLERYAGTWFEIARLPNSFEKGLKCVTANYEIRPDGKITVTNRGVNERQRGDISIAKGIAKVPDPSQPGRLKVSFFRPFWGRYYIMELDSDGYTYALVGDPSRKYLWILAREREISPELYDRLVEKANSQGFDTAQLIKTIQNCN